MEIAAIVFAGAAGLIAIVAIVAITAIVRGWVLSILWGWFMVPVGLPGLNIPTAIGLALVAAMLANQNHREPQDKRGFAEEIATLASVAILSPLLILGMGWIVKQFL